MRKRRGRHAPFLHAATAGCEFDKQRVHVLVNVWALIAVVQFLSKITNKSKEIKRKKTLYVFVRTEKKETGRNCMPFAKKIGLNKERARAEKKMHTNVVCIPRVK